MNHDKTAVGNRNSDRLRDEFSPVEWAALVNQTQHSAARLASLRARASEELLEETVVLEAFQELDSAHEELRVAEEHLQVQADAIVFAQDVLDLERRRYLDLFEAAPEAYVVTDAFGAVTMANARAAELLNIDGSFLAGKPLLMFVDLEHHAHFNELLRTVARQDGVLRREICVRPRHLPTPVRAGISVSPILDAKRQQVGLRWIMHEAVTKPEQDTSAREIALAAQLRKCAQELADHKFLLERSARVEAKGGDALYAALAHEFRNWFSLSRWLGTIAAAVRFDVEPALQRKPRVFEFLARCLPALVRGVAKMLGSMPPK